MGSVVIASARTPNNPASPCASLNAAVDSSRLLRLFKAWFILCCRLVLRAVNGRYTSSPGVSDVTPGELVYLLVTEHYTGKK